MEHLSTFGLTRDPFANEPPTYIRAVLYDYRMTTLEERQKTGRWWKREFIRVYVEPIRLIERS